MDLTSVRYFLAAAETENVHRAAAAIPISPGSVTKAIQRLERELGVALFERRGRGLRLTDAGRRLRDEGRRLLRVEAEARVAVAGTGQRLDVALSGEEALLGSFAVRWVEALRAALPGARFALRAARPAALFARLRRGEVQAVFTTRAVPPDLAGRALGDVHFVTCVARGHPLGRRRRPIPVGRLLTHGFAVPREPFLGAVGAGGSPDGWRDDAFPREVLVRADTLHQLLAVVTRGLAVAYLPDYLAAELGLKVLAVTGCDYECRQPVHLVAHPTRTPGWLLDQINISFKET